MRTLHIALLLLLLPILALPQKVTQTIRGTVTDEDTKVPLIGATVTLVGSEPLTGATTDIDGRFTIQAVAVGRHTLLVQYLGYEPRVIPEIDVGSVREVVLELALAESTRQLSEVVVSARSDGNIPNNEMSTVSTRSFSLEQSERFAASINDPSRMALSFAGVNLTDDVTNEIVIRGNSPRGLLWRLEGVEIPVPNHFNIDGVYAGNVSLLSNNLLDQSDFSTGAFPAEYGNALSGVYDIRLRTGNDRKRQHTVQFGLLGLEASSEGPFKKGGRSSYLVNYRYSTLAIFKAMGMNMPGGLITGFQDVNLKLNFPTKKAGVFSVFVIGGMSNAYFEPEMDSTKWQQNVRWDDTRERQDNRTSFLAAGITNRYIINERNYVRTTVAVTHSGTDLAHSFLTDTFSLHEYWRFKVSNNALRIATQGNTKFNARHHLRYGVNYDLMQFTLTDAAVWDTGYAANGIGHFVQTYAQHRYKLRDDLTVTAGVNLSYFNVNNRMSIEPRAGLTYRPHKRHAIGLGLGLHSRQESLAFYLVQEEHTDRYINRGLDFSRAFHAVVSYDLTILPRLTAKTEFYWQYLFSLPVSAHRNNSYSALNDNFAYQRREMVSSGLGMNYGAELTIEKGFSRNWYALYTLSLYESRYQGSDQVWRNTRYNGNFITSVTAGKDFRLGKEKRHVIGLNLKALWAGGNRYTPFDMEASMERGEQVRDRSRDFEAQLSDYFRLDARIHFRQNFKKFAYEFSIDVQNTTNRRNEIRRRLNLETWQEFSRYQQGILPIARLRVEF